MERKLTLRDFGHEIIKKDLHLDPFGVGEELQHEIPALEDHPALIETEATGAPQKHHHTLNQ
ncbi:MULTISPECIES: hypothetical protein [Bacteria]|uniref:hypothetical protein n=1 Tax=Bacteria TaxID=2 RepID=UPI00085C17FF|nr:MULTISPECIES: hypothetical protein [Bacteria]OES77811.1 hypothetical protein AJK94_02035 [Listeria monocytogenes]UAC03911.1 hypothetical protein KVP06_16340 [Geobacter sulfurreducens]